MAQELKRNVKSVAAAYAVGKRTYYKIQGEKGLLLAVYATGRRTWLVRYQTEKASGAKSARKSSAMLSTWDLLKLASGAQR